MFLIKQLGVTPLPDNDPLDRYYYEIIVQTGIRKNAATDSKVNTILLLRCLIVFN